VHYLFFLFIFCCSVFAQDTIANLRIEKKDALHFVDGVDLGKKLKMQMSWQSDAGILKLGASSWVLGNVWVSIKDSSFLLQSPVQAKINDKRSFWLPLPSSLMAFERMLGKPLEYDSAAAIIIAKPQEEPKDLKDIWSVDLDQKNNGEVLEIKLSKAFAAEQFYAHPNYILRINGATIDSSMFQDLVKKSSMLYRAIPIQDAKSAQLTLALKDNCESVELIKKDNGKILQIVMRKNIAKQAPAPVAQTKPSSKKIKTIVIDPGHGGKDPGAIGHNSLKEKDIVLAVGKKLKSKLEANGFTVKLTRETDSFVELKNRPKAASDWGGDLFISLHCDAVAGKERQQKTEGFKFYILRAGGSEEDKAIARRENQAIALESDKKGKTEISPAEWIILDNQLALYAEKSALFAGHLVENFEGGSIKKSQTGAGQAGFMVLAGAYMPAVLAELGFITSPKDGEILNSEKGQNDIVDRFVKAVESFAK
jgi:N-acetylmuramoyl-L-alanine amidase